MFLGFCHSLSGTQLEREDFKSAPGHTESLSDRGSFLPGQGYDSHDTRRVQDYKNSVIFLVLGLGFVNPELSVHIHEEKHSWT